MEKRRTKWEVKIRLSDFYHKQIKELAIKKGVSIADLVRQYTEDGLLRESQKGAAIAVQTDRPAPDPDAKMQGNSS